MRLNLNSSIQDTKLKKLIVDSYMFKRNQISVDTFFDAWAIYLGVIDKKELRPHSWVVWAKFPHLRAWNERINNHGWSNGWSLIFRFVFSLLVLFIRSSFNYNCAEVVRRHIQQSSSGWLLVIFFLLKFWGRWVKCIHIFSVLFTPPKHLILCNWKTWSQ